MRRVLTVMAAVLTGCGTSQVTTSEVDPSQRNEGASLTTLVSATVQSVSLDNTGAALKLGYGSCRNLAAKVDLWVVNQGTTEFHNRCLVNSAADPVLPNDTYCLFKYTMPTGTPASNVIVRVWRATADCQNYADELGIVSGGFDDVPAAKFVPGSVQDAPSYSAYTAGRLVTIDKPTYTAKLDRNGGATYEFSSKIGTDPNLGAGKRENAIHANMGAALQIDAAYIPFVTLTSSPCGGQGFFNPTQAGSYCAYSGSTATNVAQSPAPVNVSCDGATNNACTSATQSADFSLFRTLNWDYGPSYQGPLNAGDTGRIAQHVTAFDQYLQYDLTFRNDAPTHLGQLEAPTFYFSNRYRTISYPNQSGQIVTTTITENRSGVDLTAPVFTAPVLANWLSVENTSLGVTGNAITLAVLRGTAMRRDQAYSAIAAWNAQQTHATKVSFIPTFTIGQNENYEFRYVIFPYRFDAVISTSFGTMTVANTIAAMRAAYESDSPPNLLPWASVTSNDVLWPAGALASNPATGVYSSNFFATEVNDRATTLTAMLTTPATVSKLVLGARMGPTGPLAFPVTYAVSVTTPNNSGWVFVGTFSKQPDASGSVVLTLPQAYSTFGVQLRPVVLGVDDSLHNHYFQLGKLGLAP